ncbi:hypothetical protein [Catenulispora pinisilvae]|uniref:hypothetical protein n=1 Tax=Catenulispora pinisilvae TaxID=2705253 RepID=UPI001890B932|nr:hypothetical protein [Catenulispora pinisilvae]
MARIRTLKDVHPTRRGIVLAWWAFTVTFGGLRLLTWAIHVHVGGFGNVTAGSVHIHHYLWGILILICVAAAGVIERSPQWHAWMGLFFGIGLALVVDEAALLIELKDVYWTGAGGVSVAIALILIGLAGSILALMWVRGIEEEKQEKREESPTGSPGSAPSPEQPDRDKTEL